MKTYFMKTTLIVIAATFLSLSQIVYAEKDNKATVVDTGTFEKWLLVHVKFRKERDKYVKIEADTVYISGKDSPKEILFFYPLPIPCANNWNIKFTFKAEGTGRGMYGFITYENDKWHPTKLPYYIKTFNLNNKTKNFEFKLTAKGDKIKTMRVLIGASPNSEVKFSDLKVIVQKQVDN